MRTRHLFRLPGNALTIAAVAVAGVATFELIDHDTQRPAYAATIVVPAVVAIAEASESDAPPARHAPELADLELVGRSIANYDR
jgi:hypothetical protein